MSASVADGSTHRAGGQIRRLEMLGESGGAGKNPELLGEEVHGGWGRRGLAREGKDGRIWWHGFRGR